MYNSSGFVFCMRNLEINLCFYVLATFQRLLLNESLYSKCTNDISQTYCCLSVLRIRVFLLCKTNGKASILFSQLVQDNKALKYVISLTI